MVITMEFLLIMVKVVQQLKILNYLVEIIISLQLGVVIIIQIIMMQNIMETLMYGKQILISMLKLII